jgi:hypothetical protein
MNTGSRATSDAALRAKAKPGRGVVAAPATSRPGGVSHQECRQKPCAMRALVARDSDPGEAARAICGTCGTRFKFVGHDRGEPVWRSVG